MDMIDAAQDAYEETLEIEEQLYLEAVENAQVFSKEITTDELTDEIYERGSDLRFALKLFDQEEINAEQIGLMIINLRNAWAQRKAGLPGAMSSHYATALGITKHQITL